MRARHVPPRAQLHVRDGRRADHSSLWLKDLAADARYKVAFIGGPIKFTGATSSHSGRSRSRSRPELTADHPRRHQSPVAAPGQVAVRAKDPVSCRKAFWLVLALVGPDEFVLPPYAQALVPRLSREQEPAISRRFRWAVLDSNQ